MTTYLDRMIMCNRPDTYARDDKERRCLKLGDQVETIEHPAKLLVYSGCGGAMIHWLG